MTVLAIPFPLGRVTADFFPSPMMKTLFILVAKVFPLVSLKWAMSKFPNFYEFFTWMLLNVGDKSNSSNIVSSNNHGVVVLFKLVPSVNFSCFEVELDSVIGSDFRVGVSDGSSVMGKYIWNLVLSEGSSLNFTELEGGFFMVNFSWEVSSLGVIENSEKFTSLFE
jgi:hypothetical protein